MQAPEDDQNDHDDFGGLRRDTAELVERRRALRWFGAVGVAGILAACSSDGDASVAPDGTVAESPTTSASTTSSAIDSGQASSSSTSVVADVEATPGPEIPDETAGPFPADGSNGPNLLEVDGVVGTDLTNSIGDLSGVADGVPTTIELTVVDAANGNPIPGAAVYLWHCTADGRYSIYEIEDQNYLRGMQAADNAGRLSFDTVFPGCYRGRWPHCHIEVYSSLDTADGNSSPDKTSQLAIPRADCETVYVDDTYGDSLSNLAELSLASDSSFADGWADQLATVSGSADRGYSISLLVRV